MTIVTEVRGRNDTLVSSDSHMNDRTKDKSDPQSGATDDMKDNGNHKLTTTITSLQPSELTIGVSNEISNHTVDIHLVTKTTGALKPEPDITGHVIQEGESIDSEHGVNEYAGLEISEIDRPLPSGEE